MRGGPASSLAAAGSLLRMHAGAAAVVILLLGHLQIDFYRFIYLL
jgi:hypothetical protein